MEYRYKMELLCIYLESVSALGKIEVEIETADLPLQTRANALGMPAQAAQAGSNQGINRSADEYLLARCIHGEARGEPYVGKVAVAAVVLNRVRSPQFPNTIAGVIYQPLAFTAVADGQINLTPDKDSLKAARDALNGWDPTYGCLYYWNPATATSKWIWSRKVTLKIGKHWFGI
jgi:N-acetylmuramoyl-L-alanine amidase